MQSLVRDILKLKREKNAVILVHNYQTPEIYKIADFIGDSFELSRKAAETKADIIVFCGVLFMAESAKILSPTKRVLLPVLDAGCPMADMITAEDVRKLRKKYPDSTFVAYVNTPAEVKAEGDICCTSSNAICIVNSLKEEQIVFVPDKNLAEYVKGHTDKEIITWDGHCYVHSKISVAMASAAKKNHPKAKLLVHPECVPEVIKIADHVASTSGMIEYAKNADAKEIIIGTECGMLERLKRECPDKTFYTIGGTCINMKKTRLKHVLEALQKDQHEIRINNDVITKARKSLDRMLNVKK
jgi:quinolinate synthase